jgi:microcystin degradation protein MlrC
MHGQGSSGMSMELGLTVVLAIGAIRLVVRSLPAMEWDPAIYTSVGLNPAAAALIFVKSPTHFRASFAPLAARLLVADSPGVTRANMRALTFTHVNRPLYPLDES